ncbi:MAG: leucyl aminopeptidase family protein [Aestuariivita sp.]|nr:leucyl aminopeptidase family protein [Aestuariivita sp.]MCY4201910.1 leucyl aminopeptidase family protein [Aestuariivita sp.]MCY4287822.1 leucyl aminopeptidase family protein [Aestuariivita sp.]MCY4345908.1 leucyl aminopeptidase family protein [Aestuariivita sp.]
MTLSFARDTQKAIPLSLIDQSKLVAWLTKQPTAVRRWVKAQDFSAEVGSVVLVPDRGGKIASAVVGMGNAKARQFHRFPLAASVPKLPKGTYRIVSGLSKAYAERECLGWLLSAYSFDQYRKNAASAARLIAPKGVNGRRVEVLANSEVLTRDLINTPTNDMGPHELEAAARKLARRFGAKVNVIKGEALLTENFPMIHTVGRAASNAPRLIDMRWGEAGPKLALVGKGVCFDTGGLNLKPGSSMSLMKKDMGGAATVLGLAKTIMELATPVQLRVLIPAVENAVAGNAFRPKDILTSRSGLTVEINNTDAEGRLVLADALAFACESEPDLLISMATLTGAARIAVGTDLAPFFTDDDAIATALVDAGVNAADPTWRLPFHMPYEKLIEPGIADLDNAPAGGLGGAITAALFLRRFVTQARRYIHFDIYGWQSQSEGGRTKGGFGQGARAVFSALPNILRL